MLTEENAKVALFTVVTTIAETEPLAAPQGHMMVGLQSKGVISPGGEGLDEWYVLLSLGRRMEWWTNTDETVSLTDKGRDAAAQIESILEKA